jgi:hypothetical protein
MFGGWPGGKKGSELEGGKQRIEFGCKKSQATDSNEKSTATSA